MRLSEFLELVHSSGSASRLVLVVNITASSRSSLAVLVHDLLRTSSATRRAGNALLQLNGVVGGAPNERLAKVERHDSWIAQNLRRRRAGSEIWGVPSSVAKKA